MNSRLRWLMGRLFSWLFHLTSILLIGIALYQLAGDLLQATKEIISIVVHCINTLIVALAMFELGVGIGKEYTSPEGEGNLFRMVTRTITRFVGTVCIAWVLEALIMIIKYSQLDLAGNLYYPIGIAVAAGILLIALGVFLKLVQGYIHD